MHEPPASVRRPSSKPSPRPPRRPGGQTGRHPRRLRIYRCDLSHAPQIHPFSSITQRTRRKHRACFTRWPPSRISGCPSCGIPDRSLGPAPKIRGDGQAAAGQRVFPARNKVTSRRTGAVAACFAGRRHFVGENSSVSVPGLSGGDIKVTPQDIAQQKQAMKKAGESPAAGGGNPGFECAGKSILIPCRPKRGAVVIRLFRALRDF